MKTKTQHTPTPWRVSQEFENNKYRWELYSVPVYGHVGTIKNAIDAAFIVRAVNSHEELLSALQALGSLPNGYCFCPEGRDGGELNGFGNAHTGECEEARQTIAKAEEK